MPKQYSIPISIVNKWFFKTNININSPNIGNNIDNTQWGRTVVSRCCQELDYGFTVKYRNGISDTGNLHRSQEDQNLMVNGFLGQYYYYIMSDMSGWSGSKAAFCILNMLLENQAYLWKFYRYPLASFSYMPRGYGSIRKTQNVH